MSRSAHQRQQQKLQIQQQQLLAQQMADNEAAAAAAEMFDLFCVATTMRQILGLHRQMCDVIGLRPAPLNDFYPKLKTKVRSWKAQALWKKFDARAAHRAYAKGNACTGSRVLVIGAGPCGLRTAIEAQLLGAKVVVVEKRDRISRNNVLHLWPFVITDLRNLGAKKFYGKFCAGSIDHISIRQLQCILLKVALLLGVEIHEGVSFDRSIEPSGDGCGWRAQVSPADHAVSHYEFDVLIGADGKRNTLEGFKRKEFRGKLAIAITANFINKKTEAEAKAEEISGVAFIFNQSFFKELYHTTGIDLENIVYYKDETHYFVMTAKKHSLIDKGVILQDFADPAELLAPINVNTEKLLDYAREAAEFSTKYQMPNLEFAVNHYGKPDVAMFDFTSMFAAESSCRVIVRHGFRLLQCLVGDSLLEPFWPTGSGCARGFLSSMDAAYAIKLWTNPANSTLGVMAQRESIYRLLGQTTPENLQRDIGGYTVDPATRYPNLNRTSVNVWQVKHLIDTDDKAILEQTFMDTNALQVTQVDTTVRRKRRSGDSMPLSAVLLRWICAQLHTYEFSKDLKEASDVFTNGKVLCALINRYRPDLVDFNAVKDLSPVEMNDLAFKILDKELQIPRIMSGKDSMKLSSPESKVWLNYLEQICEVFRGEIPHIKHPKIDFSDLREKYRVNYAPNQPDFSKLLQLSSKHKAKSPIQDDVDVPQVVQRRSVLDEEKLKRQRRHEQLLASATAAGAGNAAQTDTPRRAKKRRSAEKTANIEERQVRLQEIEQNRHDRLSKRRQQRYQQTQNFYKSLHMLQANTLLREGDENMPFEDYSIFLYRQQAPEFNDRVKELERKLLYPDRERGDIPSSTPRSNADEQFSDRIKSMEQRISSRGGQFDKKPKDLMRAIGKIDSTDWNVREIEKKIEQSKKTEVHGPKGREKVPKWSKEQFQARQHKMAKPQRQDSAEEKFKEIDQTLKNLDKQLKEGSVLEVGERGHNKVASIAGQFKKRDDVSEEKNPIVPNSTTKSSCKVALAFKKQAASEKCHFCRQTVYLMEKLQTENLVMHRGCLKCHHCHTNLRLGAYAFDRDDPNGRFYCTQHFRLPAKPTRPVVRKSGQRKSTQHANETAASAAAAVRKITPTETDSGDEAKTPEKRGPVDNVTKMDLLERGQTPERIEFENTDAMSDGEPSEEHIIDEHEWSGRNFLPESNNDSESDLSSSDESDTESDSDMFEEANDSPLGVQTLQMASEWIGKQNYSDSDDSDDFYDSSEGLADDGKDDTEGEEFEKARELRREEVRLPPLPPNLPTDTETEIQTNNKQNEAVTTSPIGTSGNVTKLETNNDATNEPTNESTNSNLNDPNLLIIDLQKRKDSATSDQSFKSTSSVLLTNGSNEALTLKPGPTKADIEKLEQNSDRKFSADIDAISEKLYHMNNVVKMNKDLDTIAKENLIRSDILKKLSMKEKWLADNQKEGVANPMVAKTKFEEKVDKILQPMATAKDDLAPKSQFNDQKSTIDTLAPKSLFKDALARAESQTKQALGIQNKTNKLDAKSDAQAVNVLEQIKELIHKEKENLSSPKVVKTPASRSNSFKSNASQSPLLKPKFSPVLNKLNSDNKMEIENILDIVKNIDISKTEKSLKEKDKQKESGKDIGRMLYRVETKFSPQPNRKMSEKLKEIEAKSFSGTLDSIKSQIETPTVSAQAMPANVDLSKYFPNQQQRKDSISNVNKNQKSLNEVDLTKYFPSSPAPQRRASVVTVADKLKKSLTEKSLTTSNKAEEPKVKPVPPKRQSSLAAATGFSLKDNQIDGAIDLINAKPFTKIVTSNALGGTDKTKALNKIVTLNAVSTVDKPKANASSKVVTTTAVATTAKKGKNVKIIKKVVRKGSLKKTGNVSKLCKQPSLITRDEDDAILDEILQNVNDEMRSPSLEYQQLFQEEKSPSDDLSDKIESILEETGIDLGFAKKTASTNQPKKLFKAKSFGEGELERRTSLADSNLMPHKEEGDLPSGVQNILKRFESMSSVPGSAGTAVGDQSFKLRRMESTTSNLNKSKESIVSRESDNLSDLEKTMEYLKSEWKSEATNFLQKKRIDFHKKIEHKEVKKDLPASNLPKEFSDKDNKFAKFFGLKQKSPEKTKTFLKTKQKSPEKRKSPLKKRRSPEKKMKQASPPKTPLQNKPIIYASLEELALLKVNEPKQMEAGTLTSNEERLQNSVEKNARKINQMELLKPIEKQHASNLQETESIEMHMDITEKGAANLNSEDLETNQDITDDAVSSNFDVQKPLSKSETNETNMDTTINHSENNASVEIAHEKSDVTDVTVTDLENMATNPRPMVADIRNLPKTGCDKSLSSSRRGSLASLQSRRLSNPLINEITCETLDSLLLDSWPLPQEPLNKSIMLNDNYDEDSLCTSISKSPSLVPITVQLRGSSEDKSIDELFSQFSDEMLVNVEFDSNDELVEIMPVAEEELNPYYNKKSFSPITRVPLKSSELSANNFPMRPKRRQKSKSSSSDSSVPLAPQRIKKKLSKLSPSDMPPSVQDLLHEACNKKQFMEHETSQTAKPLKFPRIIDEDDILIEDTPIASKLFTQDTFNKLSDSNILEVSQDLPKESIKLIVNHLNDGFGYGPNSKENVMEFTKVLTPLETKPNERLPADYDSGKYEGVNTKVSSLEWNMEMLANSPMPKHKPLTKNLNKPASLESLEDVKKQDEVANSPRAKHKLLQKHSTKPESMESLEEWNMEMLPNSPMPQRRVQSESESSSSDELEPNSATEISTDSEFDNDELIRTAPKIFIDDTHLKKPTKVQVKSTIITPSTTQKQTGGSNQQKGSIAVVSGTYLAKYQPKQHAPLMPQFKPLVQVDPSLMTSSRTPLQNPRPGDYLLNKTASTEGIASKKSLELKKRYLLGEPANGNKIQKSGSTSVLDSRIRSFQSNISECQKLLNPSNDISSSMKTFLDRNKLGEKISQELMRSATNNILNDLKVEITIQKASSTASTDNEKENVFVNSKNELNKCMEYSETVNAALLDSITSKKSPCTPTNNKTIIETIDLVTPEKEIERDKSDSNKVIDLTIDTPEKSNRSILETGNKPPDVSQDVKQCIPDILGHIEESKDNSSSSNKDIFPEQEALLDNMVEKSDAPEKQQSLYDHEMQDVQIEVPHIAWSANKSDILSTSSNSTCSSHSSSLEDIEHYILESTTSPETHNSAITTNVASNHQVPRVEVHDSSGTLMQIDSLMIIDGKYIGDPEDLKYMEVPEGIILPEQPAVKTTVLDDEHESEHDQEPITATPEPVETTVIEAEKQNVEESVDLAFKLKDKEDEEPPPLPENGPPLPEKGPPRIKPSVLKFDTKNENKIESLKNLPLILDSNTVELTKAVKPITLNLSSSAPKHIDSPKSPNSPMIDADKTPTGELISRGSDSETEATNTAQILTETELSDWTADDCISENFVDMDFVNKTGKRKSHKKGKSKHKSASSNTTLRLMPSHNEVMKEVAKTAPVAEFEGIDLDDIEFMDTGSDSSGTEPHSATNTALLRNRGYVEFVDQTTPKHQLATNQVTAKSGISEASYKPVAMKRDEKLGIDYIEQGAYIMYHDDANKTPVNESAAQMIGSTMTQSLTDSSTLNDLEDDSTNSQIQISSTANSSNKPRNFSLTTTEESEALTVVSSPLDSSPHTRNSSSQKKEYVGSTPSSTDRAPKSSQSSTSCSNSGTSSSKTTPPRQSSKESAGIPLSGDRKSNDDLSYEEYVRALQQKIVQISTTARGDSLEARKQRRKSSKGDAPLAGTLSNPNQTVIEPTTPTNLRFETKEETTEVTATITNASLSAATAKQHEQQEHQQHLNKVPEIPTLTSKLEEITKERTKQKDLIHDLVMDKLQSKKQLNAEKRLHRSRQRSILTSGMAGGSGVNRVGGGCGYSSGSSLSPTPKLAAAHSTSDNNCTNQAHYHVSTAANSISPSARTAAATQRFLSNSSSFKENNPTSSYVSAYGMEALSPTRANAFKQRPFSEHLDGDPLKAFEQHYKVTKTPSFAYTTHAQQRMGPQTISSSGELSTPKPPTRQNRARQLPNERDVAHVETQKEANFSTSTDNLRSEARARARLKSNSELGLSPEEKMQLLRKRIQEDYNNKVKTTENMQPSLRDSKMNTSKSVNDLAYLANLPKPIVSPDGSSPIAHITASKTDFTSDPNLLLSSTQSTSQNSSKTSTKSNRRTKDPERRKSLIQSLSNFFHKAPTNKENKNKNMPAASDGNSAQPEQPGTGGGRGSGNIGGGDSYSSSPSTSQPMSTSTMDGVLSRFRISPQSKEKSRDKEDYLYNTAHKHGSDCCSPTRRLRTSSASLASLASFGCQRHHSQDALAAPRSHLAHTNHSHSQLNNLNSNSKHANSSNIHRSHHQHHHQQQHQHFTTQNNFTDGRSRNSPVTKKSSSSSALAFTSSSPKLCAAHKSQSMTNTSNAPTAYDDQTPPPIPPLPLNYQRSDDESYTTETRDQKKQRAISKAVRQAELKRLRIAQEIQREQEEIEVQLKELETLGVLIEKALRGEEQTFDNAESTNNVGSNDEKLLKELLEIWRNITHLKKRDEELGIRQQELQLEHRHAQLKEELNMRLSCNKLDKSSADVAAEGAILNEMLEIVAKRASLRPSSSTHDLPAATDLLRAGASSSGGEGASCSNSTKLQLTNTSVRGQSNDIDESNI